MKARCAVLSRLAMVAIAVTGLVWSPKAEAARVTLWLTPARAVPSTSLHIVVHIRGLTPGTTVYVTVWLPAGQRGSAASATLRPNMQGAVDLPLTFLAADAGDYDVWVQVGDQAAEPSASAMLMVRRPSSRACGATQPIGHIFGTGEEVLVEATHVTLGGIARLLGVGFPPCMPVDMRQMTPDGLSVPWATHVQTDRFGIFRLPLHIPKDAQSVYLNHGNLWEVVPYVNGANGPLVTIPIEPQG